MMDKTWTRRQMLAFSASGIAAALLPAAPVSAKRTVVATAPSSAAASAEALYQHAFVLDANTLASIGAQVGLTDNATYLQAIRDSGMTALKSTLGGAEGTFEQTVADLATAQALIEQHPELFIKVAQAGDLARARQEQKVAVILSFEGVTMLGDSIDRIAMFRQLDIRVMQLSYNHKSPFGCGCLDGETDGVTPLGRKAIAQMNALGVALDLSHANTRTTDDGIALSNRPVVISHAGCRTVFEHPRNKTDHSMRAMADKGGVMGIYMLPFLTPEIRQPMLADYMQHMLHALKICGEDHVGIGTDSLFFTASKQELQQITAQERSRAKAGIGAPGENRPPYIPDLNTPRKLERVAGALLKHGYSARVTEKVLGLNFRRVFEQIWAA